MKHYGPYHGYACRTWTADDGGAFERSQECLLTERENKRPSRS